MEDFPTGKEVRGEEQSSTPNNSVELFDSAGLKVELTASQFPDFVFEFLLRLGTHATGAFGENKTEKRIPFCISGNLGFLLTEL